MAYLFEQGYFALLSAADGFDPWYGWRLSTYACNAIKKSFYRQRKTLSMEPLDTIISTAAPDETDEDAEWLAENLGKILQTDLLDMREKTILTRRFG